MQQVSHRLYSWLDVSVPLRWRGEVAILVGEGEAVLEDESLPPPASEPGGREASVGTGGALFLARNPPSNAHP